MEPSSRSLPSPTQTGSFVRHPRVRAALVFVACVLAPCLAFAAPKPLLGVSVAPPSATAGSATTLALTFKATDSGSGTASIIVPPSVSNAPWSAPQVSSSALAGYVAVQAGTCNSAGPATISGSNTILVKFKCAQGKTFKVVYGAGAAKANAAQLVTLYTFTTQVNAGTGYLPVLVQPRVTVNPGAAASLELTGLADATAGTLQAGTVTALDAYGNVATGYAGTIRFTTTDTKATAPADMAAILGLVNFSIALKTAGPDSVTATDTGSAALTDTATVTIAAGGIASIGVGFAPFLSGYPTPSLPAFERLFTSCGALPYDAYGNVASFTGNLVWTSTDSYARLPGCATSSGCGTPVPVQIYFQCMFGSQGQQTVTVTDPVSGIYGQTTLTVIGPVANPDDIRMVDPTHSGTSRYTLDVLHNDDQTSGLTGNILLGQFKNTIAAVTQQPTYTDENGQVHQVGILRPTQEGSLLAWEVNPPPLSPPDGIEHDSCPTAPTTTLCNITAPITAAYTITDGVNVSEPTTVTLHMDTPDAPIVTPSVNVVFNGGQPTATGSTPITMSLPGQGSVRVPVLETAIAVEVTPTDIPGGAHLAMTFPATYITGACGATGCPDSVILSGTAAVSGGLVTQGSGLSTTARVAPPIFSVPLTDVWSTVLTSYGSFGVQVNILNPTAAVPGDTLIPNGIFTLFGPLLTSCKIGTVNTECPKPRVDMLMTGGARLSDCLGAYPGNPDYHGADLFPVPNGYANPTPLPGSTSVTIGVSVYSGTPDIGGTITVDIWSASGTPGASCVADLWSGGIILHTFSVPVHGNSDYQITWPGPATGDYIVGTTYSGDDHNSTVVTNFQVVRFQ